MDNRLRYGRFNSSTNGDLMKLAKDKSSFGAPALSLIEEKAMERRLGRSIEAENSARPLEWGKCVEPIAFEKLGTQYRMCSNETIVHKDYPFWSGTPDMVKHTTEGLVVADIKCPITLKSFCTFIDAYAKNGIQGVRDNHKDGEKYYWQLVSNAVLTGCNKAELVIYMPYYDELDEVKRTAEIFPYQWIVFAHEMELPYLIKGNHYTNINVLPFDIPQDDIDALTTNIIKANELCTDFSFPITIHDNNITIHDSIKA